MPTYKDVLLKTQFYKDRIVNEMIKKGIYPREDLINERLQNIDRFLALFKHEDVVSGKKINVEKFNEEYKLIQQDLIFLYRLVYEVAVKEYEYIRSYTHAHMSELESLAKRYRLRSDFEIGSASLGETIFFQESGFEIENKDEYLYFNLGEIHPKKGSTLAFLFQAEGVSAEDVVFGLVDGANQIHYVMPHNYMQDVFYVPGSLSTKTYESTLQEDVIINSSFELISEDLEPDKQFEYHIFGGKDKVTVKDETGEYLMAVDDNNNFYVASEGIAEFYIYRGTYAKFTFNKAPIQTNFNGTMIDNLHPYHKIYIKADGGFGFSIMTDGIVFSTKDKGQIRDGKLFFPRKTDARDFLIEEVMPGEVTEYQAFMKLYNSNEALPEVDYIAVKEFETIGVVRT